jgi:hypothetical protein
MESVVDVTAEVVRAMEPWARAHEDTSTKPFWAVIAGGRTAVGSSVIVSIGALRSYTDVDAYLSLNRRNGDRKAASSNSSQHNIFKSTHKFASLIPQPSSDYTDNLANRAAYVGELLRKFAIMSLRR